MLSNESLKKILEMEYLPMYKDSELNVLIEEDLEYKEEMTLSHHGRNDGILVIKQNGKPKAYIDEEENLRWCTVCGSPMCEGYCNYDGDMYACDYECFQKAMTPEELEEFHTAWAEDEDYHICYTNWYEA